MSSLPPSSQNPGACVICAYPAFNKCSGCSTSFYCSKEHQLEAWPKHKRLCKIYKRQRGGEVVPAESFCGLCGNDGSIAPLKQARCCKRTICDDQASYKMFSYARNSCDRNHGKYTMCSFHHTNMDDPPHSGDPYKEECAQCKYMHGDSDDIYVGNLTSNHNFQEDIEKVERAPAFDPTKCMKCGRIIKRNRSEERRVGKECRN